MCLNIYYAKLLLCPRCTRYMENLGTLRETLLIYFSLFNEFWHTSEELYRITFNVHAVRVIWNIFKRFIGSSTVLPCNFIFHNFTMRISQIFDTCFVVISLSPATKIIITFIVNIESSLYQIPDIFPVKGNS